MPTVSKETTEYYESRIRSVLVLRPKVSLREIQTVLERSKEAPLHLGVPYIMKLVRKITAERAHRNNNANKNIRIAQLQDKYGVVAERLWIEATDAKNPGVVRVMALDKLMKLDIELHSAEMDAGVYERKVGTLDVNTTVEHQHTLAPELLTPIMNALKNYGLVKPKLIEQENANGTPAIAGAGPAVSAEPAPAPANAQNIPRV